MTGRARLGFLVPPGNPTVEPEVIEMAPKSVSVHFSRMVAHGPTGTLDGQEERNRTQIEHIGESAALLAMVKPDVIMLAHTATSYALGRRAEAELIRRLQDECRTAVATAFGSVLAALAALGATRVALGTPYSAETTLKGKALLEEHGVQVVSHGRLENVTNIYDETPERARQLGHAVDAPGAQAVFLSGLGMPTVSILDILERELGKPVISAASAMMWQALRLAGVRDRVSGYGRLFTTASELSTQQQASG
jgi:maleate cis-trans isomerase